MKVMARYVLVLGVLLAAAAAAGAVGELTLTSPADGAALRPGQAVRITWRNFTTNPVDLWLRWDGHRKKIGEGGGETDGMVIWRVPADAAGEYELAVEEAGGGGSSSTVSVVVGGGAPADLPAVYASPNPFDLSAGAGELTFVGVPAGSSAVIYDMGGREVATLSGEPLVWNGRNERGDLVAGGTYMFIVDGPSGERFTGKIAVVK